MFPTALANTSRGAAFYAVCGCLGSSWHGKHPGVKDRFAYVITLCVACPFTLRGTLCGRASGCAARQRVGFHRKPGYEVPEPESTRALLGEASMLLESTLTSGRNGSVETPLCGVTTLPSPLQSSWPAHTKDTQHVFAWASTLSQAILHGLQASTTPCASKQASSMCW
jgi:hypothetical protein